MAAALLSRIAALRATAVSFSLGRMVFVMINFSQLGSAFAGSRPA
jgi:hypothetical protein